MFHTHIHSFEPAEPKIAKRPRKKVKDYRSKAYKDELRTAFKKWSPFRIFKELYMHYSTRYNPYAKDWFNNVQRTRVMQSRAEAVFNSKKEVLEDIANKLLRNSTPKIKESLRHAIKAALEEYAIIRHNMTGTKYVVDVEKGIIHPEDIS